MRLRKQRLLEDLLGHSASTDASSWYHHGADFDGEAISADKTYQMGFINRLLRREELMPYSDEDSRMSKGQRASLCYGEVVLMMKVFA